MTAEAPRATAAIELPRARAFLESPETATVDRMRRMLAMAVGLTAIVFGFIHLSIILDQWAELRTWYAVLAVVAGVVVPAGLLVFARALPVAWLLRYAAASVVLFVVTHAMWPVAMIPAQIDVVPWIQGVNAIPVLTAAVVWQRWPVWAFAFLQFPVVATIEYVTTGHSLRDALLSATVALMFGVILAGAATALVRAARRQDEVAGETRAIAANEAVARTVEREEARINGIVHDRVLSVLVLAARGDHSLALLQQAGAALSTLETIAADGVVEAPYTPSQAIEALRDAATDPEGKVEVWTIVTGKLDVPGAVVRALSEATAEAVRNSLAHADRDGAPVTRVVQVSLDDDGARIDITDDGAGFNPASVSARRLGLRVSIIQRMGLLPGGSARVESRPGRGTVVRLEWTRGDV